MSNRVEELERQVAELQAAVNGLTEELVEMKERVRQLEDAGAAVPEETETSDAPAQPAAGPTRDAEPRERTTRSDDHVDVVEQTEGTSGAEGDGRDASAPDAEAGKAEEGEESTERGESEDGDIIVA